MAEETNNVDKKTGDKKTINLIIIGLFSFLITVVVAGTFLVVVLKSTGNTTKPVKTVSAKTKKPKAVKPEIGPLVSLGSDVIVNITSEAGTDHFLKVNIIFELEAVKDKKGRVDPTGGPAVEEVNKRQPQIRDAVITILRAKTKEKIDEKEGKDLIRSEIINTVNNFLISGRIKNVYFQDFVIQ